MHLALTTLCAVLQVLVEQASGAVDLQFLNAGFTNAYVNVTNVLLVLRPSAAKADTSAVLVNAHFDSTLGSPGLPTAAMFNATILKYSSHPYITTLLGPAQCTIQLTL